MSDISGKISTKGGKDLRQTPFEALNGAGLAGSLPVSAPVPAGPAPAPTAVKNRGRVDLLRETSGRGGKTVTVVTGFAGISQAEKERLAKEMQKSCGCGGTVKDGRIEIQGDNREKIARLLARAGFRPVLAGG